MKFKPKSFKSEREREKKLFDKVVCVILKNSADRINLQNNIDSSVQAVACLQGFA